MSYSANQIRGVPRAIYYMSALTPVYSILNMFFRKPTYSVVPLFESEFAKSVGQKYALATSHARFAFYLTLNSLNLKSGDEVLLSPINIPDMINMVNLSGATPKLVDYQKKSFELSTEDLESKITPKTRVLFYAVLAGILPQNFLQVLDIAKRNNTKVILDMTQSYQLTLNGLNLDSYADISIYSLCDLKDIHTHRGAMITTNSEELTNAIANLRNKIQTDPSRLYFIKFIAEDFISLVLLNRFIFHFLILPILKILYRFNKMEEVINLTKGNGLNFFGVNVGRGLWGGQGSLARTSIPREMKYRFTDLQAKIGLNRLKNAHLHIEKRIKNAKRFIAILKSKNLLLPNLDGTFWKLPIWVEDISSFQKKSLHLNIDVAPSNLPCLSSIPSFSQFGLSSTEHAIEITNHVVYVPLHPYLTTDEIDVIAQRISSF